MACMKTSEWAFFLSIITSLLVTILAAVLQTLAWHDSGPGSGLFVEVREDTWNTTGTCFLEARWIYYTWIGTLTAQIIWLIYASTYLIREAEDGRCLFEFPLFMPVSVIRFFIFGMLLVTMWIVLWVDLDFVHYSTLVLFLAVAFFHTSLGLSIYYVTKHDDDLYRLKKGCDVWLSRLLVHNCLGALGSWTSIISLYRVSFILLDHAHIDIEIACYVTWAFLLLYLIVFFIVDILLVLTNLSGLFTPYLLIGVTQLSTLLVNRNAQHEGAIIMYILAAILIVLTSAFFIMKCITFGVTIYRRNHA